MAFEKKATLLGANEQFQVNPDVKKYTLRDNGFEETKKGNFQLIRTMDANLTSNQGVKLKIVVSDELTQLKLSVTTGNGLRTVNIYNGDAYKETREKVAFTLADLVERGVLVKV
ncbi:cysteine desulfurase [Carnobacterium jeotgali]|uniref:cysteine desulfurase n=1 Tax=Carnobacterium jeotgali TaxID=545534 RepID=UPI00388F2AE9